MDTVRPQVWRGCEDERKDRKCLQDIEVREPKMYELREHSSTMVFIEYVSDSVSVIYLCTCFVAGLNLVRDLSIS